MKATAPSPCWKRFACAWRKKGIGFDAAVPRVSREVVFTTHTPVPAGHDRFDAGLIEEHLGPLARSAGPVSARACMGLGRENPDNPTNCSA